MKKLQIKSKSVRVVLTVLGLLVWVAMFITGLQNIHWLFYLPAVFATLGGVTGYCPGMILMKLIFREFE